MNSFVVIYDDCILSYISLWMSHVTTIQSCNVLNYDMNALWVIYVECVLKTHISQVDDSFHNTRHDREYNVLVYDKIHFWSSMMNTCRVIFHVWMSHVTTHDTIEYIICSSMMNSLLVISDKYMSGHISHMDDPYYNTRLDRVCNAPNAPATIATPHYRW